MEIDADRLFEEVQRTIDAAAAWARAGDLSVDAVATAAFWHSVMGVDAGGSPTTPVYGWGDTRAAETALDLRERIDEAALHARTGCFLHPSYPTVKLAWLRESHPGAFARTARWVSFPEYLEWRLLGRWRCSLSMASGSGLLNVHTGGWDAEAMEMAGVWPGALSTVVDAADEPLNLLHDAAERWPELAGIPWFPALGDGACANAGSGAIGGARPGLTVGTSAAVRTLWRPSGAVVVPEELWCYRLDRRWWVAGGALSNGGGAIASLRRTLQLPEAAETDARVATLPPDGHGLTILPFLRGERGPGWTEERGGSMIGLTGATRPEEILRGWMEAIAYRIVRVERRLEEVVGRAEAVVASGGALQASAAWSRILADALDRPVLLSSEPEETSRGAALVALEALGAIEDIGALTPATVSRLEPDEDACRAHEAAMERQQRLLNRLAPWMSAEPRYDMDRFS